MRVVIQRAKEGYVKISNETVSKINKGLVVLVGIKNDDTIEDIKYITKKILNMRIFKDDENKMNLSLKDVKGDLLVVSNFTLYGDAKKGNRPSYITSGKPEIALPLYNEFVKHLNESYKVGKIETGEFGADMEVSIVGDGPVTILLDSEKTF